MSERILLTGANGMVGRNLLEHPGLKAHVVIAPRRTELDLRAAEAVRRYVRHHRPSLVIHAAGRVGGIAANLKDPAGFLGENVRIGMNLAEAAAVEGVPRFLNLSSSCVYPREEPSPLSTSRLFSGPVEPTNEGYALAKLTVLRYGELLAAQVDGFSWVSLIPCNLFGRWDHYEPDRSHMLAAAIRKVHNAFVNGEDAVTIWGSGEARREFMLASDLAALILAAIQDFDRLPSRVNLGVGVDYTVNAYYRIVADVIGYRGGFVNDFTKPSGMPRKLVDTSVQAAMGWPAPTDLRKGVEMAYDFFCKNVSD